MNVEKPHKNLNFICRLIILMLLLLYIFILLLANAIFFKGEKQFEFELFNSAIQVLVYEYITLNIENYYLKITYTTVVVNCI